MQVPMFMYLQGKSLKDSHRNVKSHWIEFWGSELFLLCFWWHYLFFCLFLFVFPTLGMYSTSKNKGVQNRLLGSSKVESGSHPVGLLLQLRSSGPWPQKDQVQWRGGARKKRLQSPTWAAWQPPSLCLIFELAPLSVLATGSAWEAVGQPWQP